MEHQKNTFEDKIDKALSYLSKGHKMLSSRPIFSDSNRKKEYHLVFYKEKDIIRNEPFTLKSNTPRVIFINKDEISKAESFFDSYLKKQ